MNNQYICLTFSENINEINVKFNVYIDKIYNSYLFIFSEYSKNFKIIDPELNEIFYKYKKKMNYENFKNENINFSNLDYNNFIKTRFEYIHFFLTLLKINKTLKFGTNKDNPYLINKLREFYLLNQDIMKAYENELTQLINERFLFIIEKSNPLLKIKNFPINEEINILCNIENNYSLKSGMTKSNVLEREKTNDSYYKTPLLILINLDSNERMTIVLLHELIHIWDDFNNIINEIANRLIQNNKYEDILKEINKISSQYLSNINDDENSFSKDNILEIVKKMNILLPLLSFNEFLAFSFSSYIAKTLYSYNSDFLDLCEFNKKYLRPIDKLYIDKMLSLYDWIFRTNFYNNIVNNDDYINYLYKLFIMYILCLNYDLDYAINNVELYL